MTRRPRHGRPHCLRLCAIPRRTSSKRPNRLPTSARWRHRQRAPAVGAVFPAATTQAAGGRGSSDQQIFLRGRVPAPQSGMACRAPNPTPHPWTTPTDHTQHRPQPWTSSVGSVRHSMAHRRRADIERHACREPAGPTTATSSATLRKAVVIIRWTLVAPLRLRNTRAATASARRLSSAFATIRCVSCVSCGDKVTTPRWPRFPTHDALSPIDSHKIPCNPISAQLAPSGHSDGNRGADGSPRGAFARRPDFAAEVARAPIRSLIRPRHR